MLAADRPSLLHLPACDSLYLSAHAGEAALSCSLRLSAERARGMRVLVATAFASEPSPGTERLRAATGTLGAEELEIGLPGASQREPFYGTFRSVRFGRHPQDEACIALVARRLSDLVNRVRPREVYVPLGVGADIDHRICHEAAMRVVQSGAGRNVFLYEERPDALVPGAVRVRLGQLGARLPPAACGAAAEGGLVRFLFAFYLAPQVRQGTKGIVEHLRCTREAAREWRRARAWHPQKAFGARLQPVLQPGGPEDLARLRRLLEEAGTTRATASTLARAQAYARRLGAGECGERYWLLLPAREGEAQPATGAAPGEELAS